MALFPNVTYANTSSKNASEICKKINISDIEMYYVTRSYATRHGSGWMSNESNLKLKNNEHETCVVNEYQKEFRLGYLDYDLLNYALTVDMAYTKAKRINLVVTCMDQIEERFKLEKLHAKFHLVYGSYSPDSKDFKLM